MSQRQKKYKSQIEKNQFVKDKVYTCRACNDRQMEKRTIEQVVQANRKKNRQTNENTDG